MQQESLFPGPYLHDVAKRTLNSRDRNNPARSVSSSLSCDECTTVPILPSHPSTRKPSQWQSQYSGSTTTSADSAFADNASNTERGSVFTPSEVGTLMIERMVRAHIIPFGRWNPSDDPSRFA